METTIPALALSGHHVSMQEVGKMLCDRLLSRACLCVWNIDNAPFKVYSPTCIPELATTGLRDCQTDAITGLDRSLAKDNPRALIQVATGSGKTFTACTFSYRLVKHTKARPILFLVDRNNLGDQTLKEYQQYEPPGSGRRFTDIYNVQRLPSSGATTNHLVRNSRYRC